MYRSFCFFPDIGPDVGTGHFWRVARLANQLSQKISHRVTFITPDNKTARAAMTLFLKNNGPSKIKFVSLSEDAPKLDPADIFAPYPDRLLREIPRGHATYIIDNYRISRAQLQQIKTLGTIVVIDDFNHRHLRACDADLIINPALDISYWGVKALKSPKHHLIPKEYFTRPPTKNDDTIIVSFGGTDKGHMGLQLVDILIRKTSGLIEDGWKFKVVVPVSSEQQTYRPVKIPPNVEIIRSYKMPGFFNEANFIICAGGQTALEARACGLSILGLGVLNKSQTTLGLAFGRKDVVVQDLQGIAKGLDPVPALEAFAGRLQTVLSRGREAGVRLPSQNPHGYSHLLREILRLKVTRLRYVSLSNPLPK